MSMRIHGNPYSEIETLNLDHNNDKKKFDQFDNTIRITLECIL